MPVSPADHWGNRQKQRRIEPLVMLDSRDYGSWRNNGTSPANSPSTMSNKSPPVFQTEKKRVHWSK